MELVFGRVGFEREILGVKEEGRGRFVVGDAGVCVCVCVEGDDASWGSSLG